MQVSLFKFDKLDYSKILILGLVYFLCAKLGLSLAGHTAQVTAIWPASGVALAAILIFGYRIWPGVALGAFLVNITTQEPLFTAAGIALSNTGAALFGAYLLKEKSGFENNMSRLQDVIALILAGGFVSILVSSTLGTANLAISKIISWQEFAFVWTVWWAGDMSGILIMTPLILALTNKDLLAFLKSRRVEAGLFFSLLILVCVLLFLRELSAAPIWAMLPFLVWSSLRLRQIGSATTNFLVALSAVAGTTFSYGPFTHFPAVESNLLFSLSYIFVFAATNLILSSAIEERAEAIKKIKHQVYYDQLTGLPNRYYFFEKVNSIINQAPDSPYTLFRVDMDRFKVINETLGYGLGDDLLKVVALRIKETLDPGGLFSRLESDGFLIFMDETGKSQHAKLVADRILECLKTPFTLDERDLYVTASIGISSYPEDGRNALDLVKNARLALFHAKELGRNNYQFYKDTQAITSAVPTVGQLNMETALRRALQNNELVVYYEPLIDLKNGEVCKLEALVRWQDPDRGLIMPGEFIHLAEATGMIDKISEFVLETAIETVSKWQKIGCKAGITVNIPSRQFHRPDFADNVRRLLYLFDLRPQYLEFELTERTLLNDTPLVRKVMEQLKSIGVTLCLDDFHTGYSSLNYIKQFPIDVLKIDRSFVAEIPGNDKDCAIAETTIRLAHSLNKKVAAEGIENKKQLKFFIKHECDFAQGYLFAKAMPAENCFDLIKQKSAEYKNLVTA